VLGDACASAYMHIAFQSNHRLVDGQGHVWEPGVVGYGLGGAGNPARCERGSNAAISGSDEVQRPDVVDKSRRAFHVCSDNPRGILLSALTASMARPAVQ